MDDRAAAVKALRHWQTDPHLAGVRDKQAIGQLPEQEREAWTQLWSDVATLVGRLSDAK